MNISKYEICRELIRREIEQVGARYYAGRSYNRLLIETRRESLRKSIESLETI